MGLLVEVCNPLPRSDVLSLSVIVAFILLVGARIEPFAFARGEHNLHMDERDRQVLRVQNVLAEDFVEVSRRQDLRAFRASSDKMRQ